MPDINNLALAEEPLVGFNPSAEMYLTPAPPPDGTYQVRLEQQTQYLSDEYWKEHKDKEGQPYFSTKIIGYLIDPTGKYDNRLVFGDFVSTKVFSNGMSTVAQVIKALGFDDPLASCSTHRDIMNLFDQAIASGAPLKVVTAWTANKYDSETRTRIVDVKGMKNFPPKLDKEGTEIPGEYLPFIEIKDEAGDVVGTVEAKAVMIRYYPLGAQASAGWSN